MKKVVLLVCLISAVLLADPLDVILVGTHDEPGGAINVHVSGSYAYVSYFDDVIRVIDISDPLHTVKTGFYNTADYALANDIFFSGNCVYVAEGPGGDTTGLRIIDVSSPSMPSEESYTHTAERAHDVFVAGNYAYVAECLGLQIYDVSNPALPVEEGFCEITLLCHPQAVYVQGNYAYVVGRTLVIVDISSVGKPFIVDSLELPGFNFDVFVSGDYAYVASYEEGLRVIDVSDPEDPHEVGFYDTPGWANSVYGHDTLIFVADDFGGLRVVDVSDPADPQEIASYLTPNIAKDVYYSDPYIYLACHNSGLLIFELGEADITEENHLGRIHVSGGLNRLFFDVPCKTRLALYSADGRLILEATLEGNGIWQAPAELDNGVYFTKLSSPFGELQKKFIVVR